MRSKLLLLTVTLGTAFLLAALAFAAADREVVVNGATPLAEWEGAATTASNQTFSVPLPPQVPIPVGLCGKEPVNYCEDTLVNVDVPADSTAKMTVTIDGFTADFPPPPVSVTNDFDVYVYKSDESGAAGEFIVDGGEGAGTPEVVEVANPSGYYLVRVVYFATNESGYMGHVQLTGAPAGTATGTATATTTAGATATATATAAATATPRPTTPPATTPAPTATPPVTAPGALPVSGPLAISVAVDKGKRSTARKRGLRARLRCSVQCSVTATATIDKRTARKLKLGKKAFKFGTGKATITKPGRIPFYVKLNKKAKKALSRKGVEKFPVTVALRVTDAKGGQAKSAKKKITLR
jgi:hypothetical protein